MSDSDADMDVKDEKQAPTPPPPKSDQSGTIVYDEKIEIHTNIPLPLYHVGTNKAYSAHARDKGRTHLIAIVCESYLVPRIDSISTYKNMINPNLAQIVEHGKIYWPPAKQERYVLFYLANLGKPLLQEGARAALGWRQDEVMQMIVKPMVNILQDFRDKDFVHGGIRPSNMFDGDPIGKIKKIILGDCLTAPPSYAQPALYEPIERAMADPIARGKGTQADDLYAFGVSLTVILRQHDPMFDMTDGEMIEQKITQSSYIAITGDDRFKGEILELLRGLLHDDPAERWTLKEVLSWLDGKRLSPKQTLAIKKATRPLHFHHDKFILPNLVAIALTQNTAEAKKIVEDDSLTQWIERSMSDEELSVRFEKSLSNARQTGVGIGYEDRLASNLSMALDPTAPLRYKGLSLMGEGIGFAMIEAVVIKSRIAPYVELFTHNIAANWLSFYQNPNSDLAGLHTKFEHCRRVLKSNKIGEGFERALYMLCPESHCLSEILQAYFVQNPDDLLEAFEDLCKKNKAPQNFLDRHSVGFLLQKDSKVIEPCVYDLNSSERHKVILANLKCLAAIQKRYSVKDVSGIAKVFGTLLPIVLLRYHDRTVREKMKKNIAEFAANGDLQKMAAILDNQNIFKTDFTAFRKAMIEYSAIAKERQKLEERLEDKDTFGKETGKEWSAILSCVISGLVILFTAFLFFSKKSFF